MAFGGSFVKEIVIIDALRTPVGRYDGADVYKRQI